MSEQHEHKESRSGERATKNPASLRESSSKSTPSNDPSNEASSVPPSNRPQTPFTPTTTTSQSSAYAYFRVPASPRSNTNTMPTGEPSSKQAKVAIPRLKRAVESGEGASKVGGRHRVTHACEPCRHRKTKCSGERPTCRHCQDFKIQCYYADGKRDRVKKQFGSMQDKVAEYEKILRDLAPRVSDTDAELIQSALERAAQLDIDEAIAEDPAIPSVEIDAETEASGAESEASGGRGSTGALDRTEEDFTREGAKATGFMGKNSDVAWMQRLRQENKYGEGTVANDPNAARLRIISGSSLRSHGPHDSTANVGLPEADGGFTIQDSSYHLNDLAISTFEAVDPYEMPPDEHARTLFMTYMNRVHPSFPIVGRINLQTQFAKFLARPMNRPPPKWLAIVNMIFAISAKYSHLIQAEWQADERDHLIYFTRARMLSVDADTIFNHPDLQMIQIMGLMSFYLMAVDQVNRSWSLTGFTLRAATALGLNMRNESANLSDSLKEIRYRVWWALYTLEHRLCAMTGRVNCIVDDQCTTPLPVPVMEEDFESEFGKKLLNNEHQRSQRAPSSNANTPPVSSESIPSSSRVGSNRADTSRSPSMTQPPQLELDWAKDALPNTALYFLHLVQLYRLTQSIFQKLYNPTANEGKWSDIQTQMGTLNIQLEGWYRKLPAAFDFRRKQRDRDFYEARLALGFFYYGTKQILHRPCLCRLDRKIPGQSNRSNEFNHAAASTCVMSAQEQLALIPDEPNAVGLLRVGPWASILHLIVQSTTVLLLEISFRAHHMPEQVEDLLESAKKALRWLHALGDDNLAAARAWRLCNQMLHDAVKKVGRKIDDLPDKPPRAAGPPSDEANMRSNSNLAYENPPSRSHSHQQSSAYIQQQPNLPYTSMNMSSMTAFGPNTSFDPFMHYDQYAPMAGNVDPTQMQYTQMQPDTEMAFMDQYTEQPQDDPHHGRGQSGRSGYS